MVKEEKDHQDSTGQSKSGYFEIWTALSRDICVKSI